MVFLSNLINSFSGLMNPTHTNKTHYHEGKNFVLFTNCIYNEQNWGLECRFSIMKEGIISTLPSPCYLPYFSGYKMHWTIRPIQVLEEENREKKKNPLNCHPLPPPSEPGNLHSDYKTHSHFPPKFWGGSASYSLKNMVIVLSLLSIYKIQDKDSRDIAH